MAINFSRKISNDNHLVISIKWQTILLFTMWKGDRWTCCIHLKEKNISMKYQMNNYLSLPMMLNVFQEEHFFQPKCERTNLNLPFSTHLCSKLPNIFQGVAHLTVLYETKFIQTGLHLQVPLKQICIIPFNFYLYLEPKGAKNNLISSLLKRERRKFP